jgi:hypothetical protein
LATGNYKPLFHRWEIVRGWLPALAFASVAIAIEIFFFEFVTSRGLTEISYTITFLGLDIPLSIALFLSLGNAVVILVLWMTVFESTAYVMAGPDRQVRKILYPLRMIRAAALILTPFTFVLFIPYIVESGWFIALIGGSSSAAGFYTWAFGVGQTDPANRFVASQILAALAATIVGGLQIWRVKGTRNLRLLLRRKK